MQYTIGAAWPGGLIENLFIISGQNNPFILILEMSRDPPPPFPLLSYLGTRQGNQISSSAQQSWGFFSLLFLSERSSFRGGRGGIIQLLLISPLLPPQMWLGCHPDLKLFEELRALLAVGFLFVRHSHSTRGEWESSHTLGGCRQGGCRGGGRDAGRVIIKKQGLRPPPQCSGFIKKNKGVGAEL